MTSSIFKPSQRDFLATSLAGISAFGLAGTGSVLAAGRTTDTLRLTWGYFGLTYIARERGNLEKSLADLGIKVEWVGPFPNHAPTMQAVTGGTARLCLRRQHHAGAGGHPGRFATRLHPVFHLRAAHDGDHRQEELRHQHHQGSGRQVSGGQSLRSRRVSRRRCPGEERHRPLAGELRLPQSAGCRACVRRRQGRRVVDVGAQGSTSRA